MMHGATRSATHFPVPRRPAQALPPIGTVRHFAPGQTIFAEGERGAEIMLVIHGMVRSCSSFSDGRRFIGAFYAAGDTVAPELYPSYCAAAEAVCQTAGVFYPAPDWTGGVPPPDGLSRRLFNAEMLNHVRVGTHARLLGRLHAIEKMSSFLLQCYERSDGEMLLTLEMTRLDIADYLGLTVETVSRCLARLKQDGVIGLPSSRQVALIDLAALRAGCG